MILLKNSHEIKHIQRSGEILGTILKKLTTHAREGMTLKEIDVYAQDLVSQQGVIAAFLGYQPDGADSAFPAAICTSVNEVVVHGTPTDYRLRKGDLLTIDMGIVYEGMYSDAARTVSIGKPSKKAKTLLEATHRALWEGIEMAKEGNTTGDIGWAIAREAKKNGVKVIKSLTGHGVGFELHEDPPIYNFGKRGEGEVLKKGMVLAIEPMFSLSSETVVQYEDESYGTDDKSLSAHFEETVVITDTKPQVVTNV